MPKIKKVEKIEKNAAVPPGLSGPRKLSALAIRSFGYLIGAVLALFYLYLFIEVPPPDWQHMRLRSFILGYIAVPLGILFGCAWLFGWVAGRIDKKPPLD